MTEAMQAQDKTQLQAYEEHVRSLVNNMIRAMPIEFEDEKAVKMAAVNLRVAFMSKAADGEFWKCDPESVARCVALSAVSGLMPGGHKPDIDLIPRQEKGVWKLNWQIGSFGYKRACRRNGPDWNLKTGVVYTKKPSLSVWTGGAGRGGSPSDFGER